MSIHSVPAPQSTCTAGCQVSNGLLVCRRVHFRDRRRAARWCKGQSSRQGVLGKSHGFTCGSDLQICKRRKPSARSDYSTGQSDRAAAVTCYEAPDENLASPAISQSSCLNVHLHFCTTWFYWSRYNSSAPSNSAAELKDERTKRPGMEAADSLPRKALKPRLG